MKHSHRKNTDISQTGNGKHMHIKTFTRSNLTISDVWSLFRSIFAQHGPQTCCLARKRTRFSNAAGLFSSFLNLSKTRIQAKVTQQTFNNKSASLSFTFAFSKWTHPIFHTTKWIIPALQLVFSHRFALSPMWMATVSSAAVRTLVWLCYGLFLWKCSSPLSCVSAGRPHSPVSCLQRRRCFQTAEKHKTSTDLRGYILSSWCFSSNNQHPANPVAFTYIDLTLLQPVVFVRSAAPCCPLTAAANTHNAVKLPVKHFFIISRQRDECDLASLFHNRSVGSLI